MVDPQGLAENLATTTDEGTRQSLTQPTDSLLLQWALYFSRFDPLAAMVVDDEYER